MTLTRCCLGFAALLLATPLALADENRVITVTGTATVHYLPDAARIQFRIRSSEPNLDDVRQSNQKAMKMVDEKLSALKIKDMKIAFSPLSSSASSARSRFDGGGFAPKGGGGGPGGGGIMVERNVMAYRTGTLIIRDSDVERLAEAISKIEKTLTDAGVAGGVIGPEEFSSGLSVTYFRREDSEFRDEALTKAVQNAMQKANALAKGAGVKIKETVSIVENTDSPSSDGSIRSTRIITTATSGELEVTVRVTVKCSY